MGFSINYKSGAVCIPADAIENGNLLQLRLLMLLSYERELCSAGGHELAVRLGCRDEEIEEAAAELIKSGMLSDTEAVQRKKALTPSAESKNYTGEEISALLEGERGMKQLIDECQGVCGKIFTPTEVSKIVSLHDRLGLESEMILLLFFYCYEKLDAQGRKISVGYVEKSAYSMYNQEIDTADKLQDYIRKTEAKNSNNYKLRRLFGTGERSFTKKEKGFFEKWLTEWAVSFELVEHAYDITVDRTGRVQLEYMSKILSEWKDSGIKTPEEADKSSEIFKKSDSYRKKFKEKSAVSDEDNKSSFNTDEFFEKALKRSYDMMNSVKTKSGN